MPFLATAFCLCRRRKRLAAGSVCGRRAAAGRGGLVFWVALMSALPADAFDLLTLWRQPMIPLHLIEGSWVDYRSVVLEGGRRTEDLTRVQCVGAEGGVWLVEMLPLAHERGQFAPVRGEGLRLRLSQRLLRREGELIDIIEEVVRWRDGQPTRLKREEWVNDPLIASSLRVTFSPRHTGQIGSTVRIVSGRELQCDQFEFAGAETVSVELPRGRLLQMSSREISAAVNAEVPFLGLVFVTERRTSSARLDPPSPGRALPPPSFRVETMELVGFGNGARARLAHR